MNPQFSVSKFMALLLVIFGLYVAVTEVSGADHAVADDGQQIQSEMKKSNEKPLKAESSEFVDMIQVIIKNGWSGYQKKESTSEAMAYQKNLTAMLETLRDVQKQASIEGILEVERAILNYENETVVNSAEMADSNKWAIAGMEEALVCVDYLTNQDRYADTVPVFSLSDTQNGLPLDAFRKFVQSHSSRLTGHLRSVSSELEKEVIRQRRENLATAEAAYIHKQDNALKIK